LKLVSPTRQRAEEAASPDLTAAPIDLEHYQTSDIELSVSQRTCHCKSLLFTTEIYHVFSPSSIKVKNPRWLSVLHLLSIPTATSLSSTMCFPPLVESGFRASHSSHAAQQPSPSPASATDRPAFDADNRATTHSSTLLALRAPGWLTCPYCGLGHDPRDACFS